MDLDRYRHTESIHVAAAPEVVYDLVADVTRMGEWSPVCKQCEWIDDRHFRGTNVTEERTWQTVCRVDAAERGREFTFTNTGMAGDRDLVRWSYTFAADGDGTTLTEAWQVLPDYAAFMESVAPGIDVAAYLDGVVPRTREGMAETVARIKAAAEAPATPA